MSDTATLEAGIHAGIPMDDYVQDRICAEPSVSTGIVQAMYERSPLHAWQAHPKLGGGCDDESSRADLGSAVHAEILGGGKVVYAPQEFQDWRKKDAQTFRDEARSKCNIPLLDRQREQIDKIVKPARLALSDFGAGKSEMTMLWQDDGVWCRGRADFLTDDGKYDIDIKTCTNADPSAWIRGIMCQSGYDLQAALRVRGHEILNDRTRDVLFLLVEIEPPYGVSVVGIGPNLVELSQRRVKYALKLWKHCLAEDSWPSYDQSIKYAEPPSWMVWDVEGRGIA